MSNYATYADDIEANEGPITGATDVMATAGTAFTRMSAETIPPDQAYRDLESYEVQKWVAAQAVDASPPGTSEVDALHAKVKAGTETTLERVAYNELNNGGVKASDAEVRDLITSILPTSGASLIALAANPDVPKWDGLKLGYLVNAIEWRAGGLV